MRNRTLSLLSTCCALALALVPVAAAAQSGIEPPDPTKPLVPMSVALARADSVVKAQGGPSAGSARLLLSWNAPYGHPRARSEKRAACGDATGADTLYLSFLPGRTAPAFSGITGAVRFHAAVGDSLTPWWQYQRGGPHAGGITVEFGPDPSFPYPQPWTTKGVGQAKLDRDGDGILLRLVYAVPQYATVSTLKPDSIYAAARIILRHAAGLPGCDAPVCIEWESGTLAFGLKDEPLVHRGERFVSWNSPGGAVSVPYRKRLEAWKPRGAGAKP